MKRTILTLLLGLTLFFLAGCESGGTSTDGDIVDGDQPVIDGDDVTDGDDDQDTRDDDGESDGDIMDTDDDLVPDGDALTDGDTDLIDGDTPTDGDTDLSDGDTEHDEDTDPEEDSEQCPEMWEGPAPPDCQRWDCELQLWPTCWVCNLIADPNQNGLSCEYCEGDCECTEQPCVCLDGACIPDTATDGDVDEDFEYEAELDTTDGDVVDGDLTDGDLTDGDVDPDTDQSDGDVVDGDIVDEDVEPEYEPELPDGDMTDGDLEPDTELTDGDVETELEVEVSDGDMPDGDIVDGDLEVDTDIVDCANHNCDENATCEDIPDGGFTCTCNEGYFGPGMDCITVEGAAPVITTNDGNPWDPGQADITIEGTCSLLTDRMQVCDCWGDCETTCEDGIGWSDFDYISGSSAWEWDTTVGSFEPHYFYFRAVDISGTLSDSDRIEVVSVHDPVDGDEEPDWELEEEWPEDGDNDPDSDEDGEVESDLDPDPEPDIEEELENDIDPDPEPDDDLDLGDGDIDDEGEGDTPYGDYYYPPIAPLDDTWETVTPASLGWDEAKLAEALEYVEHDGDEDHNSTGFLILYRGRIVVEQYWDGWDLHTSDWIFSASKSVMAVLTCIAIQDGLLATSDIVTDRIGEWSNASEEQEQRITVRHLLTMTSGLGKWLRYRGDPGTIWKYNTPAYKHLQEVLEAVTEQDLNAFTQERLCGPIGMRESSWSDTIYMDASVLDASVRDMARFGLLVLSDGAWDGTPILSDQTYFRDMLSKSQDLNPAYGYLWWLNGKEEYLVPGEEDTPGEGWIIPDGPRDLMAALGTGDKKIYVVPRLDLVVIRHGGDTGTPQSGLSSFDNELWRRLMLAMPD